MPLPARHPANVQGGGAPPPLLQPTAPAEVVPPHTPQTIKDSLIKVRHTTTSGQGGGGQGGISNISIPQTGQANIIDPTQFGAFIGKPGPFIANFVDSDGDGVDDRFQSGPGQPSSQTFVNPKCAGNLKVITLYS